MKSALKIFLYTFLILVVFVPSYYVMQQKKERIKEYEDQIRELKEKNHELSAEQQRLEHDPTYLEAVAREKMGIAREGEVIYHLNRSNK
ncbi:MAG: septum formation initiator family protein [Candidatus Omnitrophica bacterium]|nr:septum formation initiator family protein [Candidatus Omnitrophota bacterium]